MEIDQKMKTALKAGLPGFQPVLPDHTADILCAFGQAVIEQNKVMNLTAITTLSRWPSCTCWTA